MQRNFLHFVNKIMPEFDARIAVILSTFLSSPDNYFPGKTGNKRSKERRLIKIRCYPKEDSGVSLDF